MLKKLSSLPFTGTAEQEAKLNALIEKNKSDKSRLMAVMQGAQEIYGYLPIEVQNKIAEGMSVPLEKVYGVSTFYAQFVLSPKGENHIAVCLGTACYVKGSGDIYNKLQEVLGIAGDECSADRKFSLAASRCIGACGIAPAVTINGKVYPKLTVDMVEGIVDEYRAMGGAN